MTNLFTPLARSVAIASLTGAALIAGSFGPAAAQTTPSNKPPAAAAATSSKPETVEQRISQLKTALKIAPDQDSKGNAAAQARRANPASLDNRLARRPTALSRCLAGARPVAPAQPLPQQQQQQLLLRLPLSRAAGDLCDAVQLRLRRAAGGLRQHAGLLDHHPAVRQTTA